MVSPPTPTVRPAISETESDPSGVCRIVFIDPAFKRPAELHRLRGHSERASEKLGWKPRVSFEELVNMMVDADLERVRLELEHDNE